MLEKLKYHDGSIQEIDSIPANVKDKYKEVFEINSRWLIETAAQRGKWIDQSQSLNIFFKGTSGRDLSDIYFYAWKMGLKTTYYLRTLGASQVEKSTVSTAQFGSTHTRKFAETVKATPVVEAQTPIKTTLAEVTASPQKVDMEHLARVAAGEEVGICESCQG